MEAVTVPVELRISCPACGAAPLHPCRTVIDGVDTAWTHDARTLAPIIDEVLRRA
jgi:hypothetical protein